MFKKSGETETGFFARNKTLMAISTLMGTVIGAGILAIPYVVSQSGFLFGLIIIIGLGLALLLINLMIGEIVLRTKEQHQLTGYAGKYLGRWGQRLMMFSMVFSIYGALTAYLIGEGETLKAIFKIGTPLMYSLIFFMITFFIIYKGIKAAGKVEMILIGGLLFIVFLIGIYSYDKIDLGNLDSYSWTKFFVPYGVILFALMGFPAVPQLQEVLEHKKQQMRKAIMIGSLIPIFIYILFAFIVIGIIGLQNFELLQPNERIATVALSIYSSPILGIFANIVAVLAMFTSFLTLGIALKQMYEYDYHFSKNTALFLTLSVPLLITALNLSTFITVIAVTGAVAGGLEGILIIFTFWKARLLGDRKPEFLLGQYKTLGMILILLFGLGILLELITLF